MIQPAPTDLPALFQQALAHHQAGRFADARPLYQAILAVEPAHPDVLYLLGSLLGQTGDTAGCVARLGEALAAGCDSADCHANLGVALISQGDIPAALDQFHAALAREPAHPVAGRKLSQLTIDVRPPPIDDRVVRKYSGVRAVDAQYRKALALTPNDSALLLRYNRFRVANARHLAPDRPRVVIGGMNATLYPNFHTTPLLQVADVVSLTFTPVADPPATPDRVYFDLNRDSMADLPDRLPDGFVPSLFWDNQVCGDHSLPRDLALAPFPTAGGLCHHFRVFQTLAASRLFDMVAPLSTAFTGFFRTLTDRMVLDLPFGLNWGSFHHLIAAGTGPRPIDLAVTFDARADFQSLDQRSVAVALAQDLARRCAGRYRIEFFSGLSREKYFEVLQQSRIALNVVGIHGPYNYRTCEVINAGAMLLQMRYDHPFIRTDMDDYFVDGREFVSFTAEDFERKALHYLAHENERYRIAEAGRRRLVGDYGYGRLYRNLFAAVAGARPLPPRPARSEAQYQHGLVHFYGDQPTLWPLAALCLPQCLAQPEPVRTNNLMVLLALLRSLCGGSHLRHLTGGDPASQAFGVSVAAGLAWAADRLGDNVIAHFNHFVLGAEHGCLDPAVVGRFERMAGDEQAIAASKPDSCLLQVHARPAYADAAACRQARLQRLELPWLQTGADPSLKPRILADYFLWHLARYRAGGVVNID